MSRAQSLLVFAGIAATAVVGTMAVGMVRQSHIDVYFDNGLSTAVTVSVDGESFGLGNGSPLKRQLPPGDHDVVVSGPAGEIERARVHIGKKNLIRALTAPEFYVYNVAEAHIYRRATHVYATEESKRAYSDELYPFQQFFSQPEADYLFVPAPNQIQIDSSTATRHEFTVARDVDYNTLANMKYREGNVADATKAIDKALELEPCHVDAFRNRVSLMTLDDRSDEALESARSWIAACGAAGGGTEAHRAYQDAAMVVSGEAPLLAEYRARRAQDRSAENDYLLGRLLHGDDALALYREALTLDPSFGRAKLALAYELLGLERFDDAFDVVDPSLDGTPFAADAAYLYSYAAVGAGRAGETSQRLQALANKNPGNATVWGARWTCALASADWNQAERLLSEYQSIAGRESLSYRVQLFRLEGRKADARQRIERGKAQADTSGEAALLDFQSLYTEGKYVDAAAKLDAIPEGTNPLYRLYAVSGLAISGRHEEASSRLAALEKELGAGGNDRETAFYRVAVRMWKGAATTEEEIASAREAGFLMLSHAYFLAGMHERTKGQASGRSATVWFRKSVATGLTRDFPYLAASLLSGS